MSIYRKLRKLVWEISLTGLPKGANVTRYYMYERLRQLGKQLPITNSLKILSISHSDNLPDLMGIGGGELVTANYPQSNLLSLNFQDSQFDYIFSDQVLEHIAGSPQQAIDECYRVLRPGGIAVHTTCFMNPIHGVPMDFWRFTPDALALLHQNYSDIIEVGGWGNHQVWDVIQDGIRFVGVPHAKWHPLHRLAMENDPLRPIVTWIVARK